MSQLLIDLELQGVLALTQKDLNDILRDALKAMVLRWRRRYLPKHFTKAGAREYHYEKRDGELNPQRKGTYSNRKLRLFSHVLPNVYTGELLRLTLQGVQKVNATVTRTSARAWATLPRKANFRIHELEIVSAAERAELERFLVEQIERELIRRGEAATVTVGIT